MIAEVAYKSLYPASSTDYYFQIKYSGKFSPFNANVRLYPWKNKWVFSLSKDWRGVSEDIVVGLLQHLILKMRGQKKSTFNIEMYEHFMKTVGEYSKKDNIDEDLNTIFQKINLEYFNGLLTNCNLKWGSDSKRTLGHYSFATDTITISSIFQNLPEELIPALELVMYHEMLHKKHKFTSKNNSNRYHTTEFRKDEKKFKDYNKWEKELNKIIRKKKFMLL